MKIGTTLRRARTISEAVAARVLPRLMMRARGIHQQRFVDRLEQVRRARRSRQADASSRTRDPQ